MFKSSSKQVHSSVVAVTEFAVTPIDKPLVKLAAKQALDITLAFSCHKHMVADSKDVSELLRKASFVTSIFGKMTVEPSWS